RRLDAVLADLDAAERAQRAVRAGLDRVDIDVLAGLEERAIGIDGGDDRDAVRHEEFLRTVLPGERQLPAVPALHHRWHRRHARIRHALPPFPGPMAFVGYAQSGWEGVDLARDERSIRTLHGGGAEAVARLDVRERQRLHVSDAGFLGERDLQILAG